MGDGGALDTGAPCCEFRSSSALLSGGKSFLNRNFIGASRGGLDDHSITWLLRNSSSTVDAVEMGKWLLSSF